jgi:hypothetical protein
MTAPSRSSASVVAASALRRSDITEALRISPARLARACTATIDRYLGKAPPEALSGAALDVLAIVAYEQPVTHADIRAIRGVDSDAVVETLMARTLIAEDPRFGGRGRPAFLVNTTEFLRRFGLNAPASCRLGLVRRGRTRTRWPPRCFQQHRRTAIISVPGGRQAWPLNTWISNRVPR